MSDRKLYDQRLGDVQGVNLVTVCWSGDEEDYKISGLLISDRAALIILLGKVEVCFVEELSNGEYELVQCLASLFHVGEDATTHPEVFESLSSLSFYEFCQKYQRYELLVEN